MRRLVAAAMERIVEHVESLPGQPAADVEGAVEAARALVSAMPRSGRPFEEILELLFERAVPKSFNTAGPGYLAYIPGGGLFASVLADLIAGSVNRYLGVFAAAPALAQLEADAVSWLAGIVGYPAGPDGARGILTSGGSLANFTAVFTARRERLPEEFLDGTLYVSDQAHHSVARAAMLAGFPAGAVRVIESDRRYRLHLGRLAAAIAADRRAGRRPFLVVASAGTTNTGAVDPLRDLSALCGREGLWLHADAAYGGFFMLTEGGRRVLDGLDLADSVTLDPHKGMFLPYGTGALLVRDGAALARAHAADADPAGYLPPAPEAPDLVDFHALSPELSRPFRGLRVWLALQLHGAGAFAAALEEKLLLARRLCHGVRAVPGVEILAEPELSLFAFGLAPPGSTWARAAAEAPEALDRLNLDFLDRINRRQRVHLTGTRLGGRFVLRACVLHLRTHADRIEAALEDVRAAAAEALTAAPSAARNVEPATP
jgi:aromatic-L-amino-acid decarboxylase